jgi:hypothetical protein
MGANLAQTIGHCQRDGRDWRGFEVRSSRFSELRTTNFELLVAPFSHGSRVARHSRHEGIDRFSWSMYKGAHRRGEQRRFPPAFR